MRTEHRAVVSALRCLDADLLARCKCWFGGGTAIVLALGEYRLSKDIDFLCADVDGYRELRSLAVSRGASAFFRDPVRTVREFRTDQYGIRGVVSIEETPLRFEIVREARILLQGAIDPASGVPELCPSDQVAEKLLANADRCRDRAVSFRDAIDIGMMAKHRGPFQEEAWQKAVKAYGDEIGRQLEWVVARLAEPAERQFVAASLDMSLDDVQDATEALTREYRRRVTGATKP
jgi:hypothetical protein